MKNADAALASGKYEDALKLYSEAIGADNQNFQYVLSRLIKSFTEIN